jgi:hypothetical protein
MYLDVHGPDRGRRGAGIGLVAAGGGVVGFVVFLIALLGATSSSSSSSLGLAIVLIGVPATVLGAALIVPGSILMGTSGPRVDFAPVEPRPLADGPTPLTAGWTFRF